MKGQSQDPQEIGVDVRFEEALSELEEIVRRMNEGDMLLDESLAAYTRGISLIRHCQNKLECAEQQVKVLEEGLSEGGVERAAEDME